VVPTTIPSPTVGAVHLGPLTIRAYALCILLGIFVAVWLTGRRLVPRGHTPAQALDVAAYAVPFGIVGGRLYHIITTWQPYFGKDGDPVAALYIWRGGLGIWGAVAVGALGAWIGCRRAGVSYAAFADAAAPGIIFAQAIGRWGNWFNNELYGRPTTAPWGLQIHEWDQVAGRAVVNAQGHPVVIGYFQPTFLFESVFLVVLGTLLLVLDRRLSLRPGQVFALYIAGYPVGRIFIELMRSDQANHILGLRVNVWTSVLVFLLGVYLFRRAGRAPVPDAGPVADGGPATDQTSAGDAEVPADATPDPAGVGHPTERPPNDHDAR
jgi:prolipoprotein diacylglyceryl transferase